MNPKMERLLELLDEAMLRMCHRDGEGDGAPEAVELCLGVEKDGTTHIKVQEYCVVWRYGKREDTCSTS